VYFDSLRAVAARAVAADTTGTTALALVARGEAGLGLRREALARMAALDAIGRRREQGDRIAAGRVALELAIAYALLGDTEAALGQLERALVLPTPISAYSAGLIPELESLRGTPTYERLMAERRVPVMTQ
jgi:hypothetical protein